MDAKKERSFEGCSSNVRLDIKDKPRLKKRLSHQVPPKFLKALNNRFSNPRSQERRYVDSQSEKPTCGNYCRKHRGECLMESDNYFCCGKSGHKVRDCPNVRGQEKGSGQSQ